jgi:hypothetical protein
METHPFLTTNGFISQLKMTKGQVNEKKFLDGGIWTNESKCIIIGTFPPYSEYYNRTGYIHYSSPRNKFWKHIDSIYKTNLYISSIDAKNSKKRVENAIEKIEFIQTKELGFIDIFTKIDRKVNDAKDENLIQIETIFDDNIFENILKSNVDSFVFVYSLALETFISEIQKKYKVVPKLIRKYKKDDITLEVQSIEILNKIYYLSYCPIHGNNEDAKRQPALKKAIEFDFN